VAHEGAQEGRPLPSPSSLLLLLSEVLVGLAAVAVPLAVADAPVACAPCRGIQLVTEAPAVTVPLGAGAALTSGLTLLPPFALE
jgi:hypothetical protein